MDDVFLSFTYNSALSGTSRQLRMRKRKKATVADAEETLDARRKRKKSRRADFPTLTTRSSPVQFSRCISVLSSEQQLAVKEMGFGRLLHFRMDGVPGKLAHFVIDSFDPDTMEIHAPCGAMKINKTVVRKLLGIPSGGVKLMSTETKIEMDSAVSNWRKRYSSKLVFAKSMVDSIEKSGGADSFDFRMDFLMCFVTVMIDCHKQGTLREAILYHISSNMKFSDVDWCGLLVDQLKECKQGWDSTDPNSPFTGPLATLTLLYVDRASCPGLAVDYNVYPITYWTAKRLKEREKQEIINGGFGKGWLKCLSITWDKDDQPSVKDRVQVVETNIDEILKYKKRVEDVLGQLCVKHPEDVDVLTLKARYATLLHDKPMWIRDAEASQQIKEVLGG